MTDTSPVRSTASTPSKSHPVPAKGFLLFSTAVTIIIISLYWYYPEFDSYASPPIIVTLVVLLGIPHGALDHLLFQKLCQAAFSRSDRKEGMMVSREDRKRVNIKRGGVAVEEKGEAGSETLEALKKLGKRLTADAMRLQLDERLTADFSLRPNHENGFTDNSVKLQVDGKNRPAMFNLDVLAPWIPRALSSRTVSLPELLSKTA
ncbi:hypothetical protein HDU67_007464 [Dinochytrium kinnereticum]|nr:hypothetical protein HDU67_007464 [Dinochytrium kinnereticum]